MNIYYAHPMAYYDTLTEAAVLEALREEWPEAHIENPNSKKWRNIVTLAKRSNYPVMQIFADYIRDEADIVVFQRFDDNTLGAGVARELLEARIWGKAVYEVYQDPQTGKVSFDPSPLWSTHIKTVAETRAMNEATE